MPSDDSRRTEAEKAFIRWEAETRDLRGSDANAAHLPYLAGYLAGDAAGYARALADLERLAVHNDEIAAGGHYPTDGERARDRASIIRGIRGYLLEQWRCTDPTHTRCQEKETDNG